MKGFQHSYFSYVFTLAPLERSMFRLKKLLPSGWGPTLYSKHTQHLHLPIKRRRPWEKPLWWGNTSPQVSVSVWRRGGGGRACGPGEIMHTQKVTWPLEEVLRYICLKSQTWNPQGGCAALKTTSGFGGIHRKCLIFKKAIKYFFFKNPIQIKQQKNNKSAVLECHSCAGPRVSDVCGV